MIATQQPDSWRAMRIGDVRPLSAILPVILRHYGLPWPAEAAASAAIEVGTCEACRMDRHVACLPDTTGWRPIPRVDD